MLTRALAVLGLLSAACASTATTSPDERAGDGARTLRDPASPNASGAWEETRRAPGGGAAVVLEAEPALSLWTPVAAPSAAAPASPVRVASAPVEAAPGAARPSRAPSPASAPPEATESAPSAQARRTNSALGVAQPAVVAASAWSLVGALRSLQEEQDPLDRQGLRDLKRRVDDALAKPYLEDARARLGRGDPETALVVADGGLAEVAEHRELLWLAAECGLRIAARTGDRAVLDEALERLRRLGDCPESWLGRSRGARLLRDPDAALEHARRALRQLDDGAQLELDRGFAAEPPQRTLAEACWLAYRRADPVSADGTSGREALAARERIERETEEALEHLTDAQPRDPWPWRRLTELRLELGRGADALAAVKTGLARHPWDTDLMHLLATAARRVGGGDLLLREFRALRDRTPNAALGCWYPGEEYLERALARFAQREDPAVLDRDLIQALDYAGSWFRRCRTISNRAGDAALARDCGEREATTMVARGWVYADAQDAVRARQMFTRAEELAPGCLLTRHSDVLAPAAEALVALAEQDLDAGRTEEACEAYERLRLLDPTSLPWARRAGDLRQLRAAELEKRADHAGRAARGELPEESRLLASLRDEAGVRPKNVGTGGERRRLERLELVLRQRARESSAGAWRALSDACALAPGDARLLVDTARIDVQTLRSDDVRSEGRLRRAVALVSDQLQERDLDAEVRFDLERALGDACQVLGTLYYERYDDPVAALGYFEEALAIGPTPRPLIADTLLPRVREAAARRAAGDVDQN